MDGSEFRIFLCHHLGPPSKFLKRKQKYARPRLKLAQHNFCHFLSAKAITKTVHISRVETENKLYLLMREVAKSHCKRIWIEEKNNCGHLTNNLYHICQGTTNRFVFEFWEHFVTDLVLYLLLDRITENRYKTIICCFIGHGIFYTLVV